MDAASTHSPTATTSLASEFYSSQQSPQQDRQSAWLIELGDNVSVRRLDSYRRSSTSTKLPPLVKSDSVPKSGDMIPLKFKVVDEKSDNVPSNNNQFNHSHQYHQTDPYLRIKQLEKNLQFVKDHNKTVLNCLHHEIEELKQKNRDLQFRLIINGFYPEKNDGQSNKLDSIVTSDLVKATLPMEVIQSIGKLEIEVKRLRSALGEALKMNASLRARLVNAGNKKRCQSSEDADSLVTKSTHKAAQQTSSKVEDFRETWRAINSAKLGTRHSFLPGIK